ncbi:MAG TPA: hypothetical protein VFM81_07450 [Actinomycetota bacterium]|nr:hypothetical protein [Actinomycetota bacterium]
MRKLLIGATIALSVLLPLGVAYATPPNNPPGQGECDNGNSDHTCDPDPNPDNGQDCQEHGNNGGSNENHCLTTTVTGPPTTTTQPPGNPCDNQEIAEQVDCSTTTTTVSSTTTVSTTTTEVSSTTTVPTTTTPPCVERCQTATTTVTVPPPTTTASPTPTVPPACPGSVRLGNWYADPQVNIFLRGEGTFKVTGGIQRFSHKRTVVATLGCGETLRVPHYKVKHGHALKVYQDGKLVIDEVPPRIN